MNWRAIRAIYRFEMARTFRTLVQSILAPVIATSLYFVVFGSDIGSRMTQMDGVPFGAFFVPLEVAHPVWMLVFLVLSATTFSLLGFVLGLWAASWEKLQFVPALVIMPLTFLGGTFYSIGMLPLVWQTITLFNPVVYVGRGFRWSFFGHSLVDARISFAITTGMLVGCLTVAVWMIRSGWRLRH